MGKFVKGDIVVVPFPFSDLSGNKRRPALVVADINGDDMILCQITSVAWSDRYAVPLDTADFESGTLPVKSFVRPNKIFTASRQLALYSPCRLKPDRLQNVTAVIIGILEK
jgi:mRNA interferase MazF